MTAEDCADGEREKIIEAATRLFSQLGYDATPTQLIVDSAGVELSTLRRHFRGNAELYREVMSRLERSERAALYDAVVAFTPTRQGMERVLDAFLDFYAANPQFVGLWLHRRTGDAADTDDHELRHAKPKLAWLAEALAGLAPDPATLDYALWTFPWVVSSFLGHGMVHSDGRSERRLGQPVTGRELEAFRRYLHTLAHRLLDLPDETPEPGKQP